MKLGDDTVLSVKLPEAVYGDHSAIEVGEVAFEEVNPGVKGDLSVGYLLVDSRHVAEI